MQPRMSDLILIILVASRDSILSDRPQPEVLSNWDGYVTNPTAIAQRGGTFLFGEQGEALYDYRHRGVLTYSETMPRPLSFLAPYIGEERA